MPQDMMYFTALELVNRLIGESADNLSEERPMAAALICDLEYCSRAKRTKSKELMDFRDVAGISPIVKGIELSLVQDAKNLCK